MNEDEESKRTSSFILQKARTKTNALYNIHECQAICQETRASQKLIPKQACKLYTPLARVNIQATNKFSIPVYLTIYS